MSNVVQHRAQAHIPALHMDETELIEVLANSLYPGATLGSIKLVIGYCKAQQLDPLQKPVHIVPMKVKTGEKDGYGNDKYAMRDVVMPGIGLYRTQAARTGQYAGVSAPEFGPVKTITFQESYWIEGDNGKRKKQWRDVELEYPEWCSVTVRRIVGGQIVEFTATEYWIENYATAGGDAKAPNAMWKKRPRGQLAKCTEAQALRKAFPELGAQPTAEEMEGKTLYDNGDIIDAETGEIAGGGIKQPRAKKAPKPQDVTDVEPEQQTTQPQADKQPARPAPSGEVVTPGMLTTLRKSLESSGRTEESLCKAFDVDALEKLPRSYINEALQLARKPEGEE